MPIAVRKPLAVGGLFALVTDKLSVGAPMTERLEMGAVFFEMTVAEIPGGKAARQLV